MNKEDIIKKVQEYSIEHEWNHYYEFPFGITTRNRDTTNSGSNTYKWSRLEPIFDSLGITNKHILDVGCGDGYFSIQCAKRGAARVIGIDADGLRIKRANLAKQLFGLTNVEFAHLDLYDEKLQSCKFHIGMGLGLLHRIPEIYTFLRLITNVSDVTILEFKALRSYRAICKWGGGQTKTNTYNKLYFLPSRRFVTEIMSDLGFKYHTVFKDRSRLQYKRTIVVSSRKQLVMKQRPVY